MPSSEDLEVEQKRLDEQFQAGKFKRMILCGVHAVVMLMMVA